MNTNTLDKWEADSAAFAGYRREGDFWVKDIPNGFWRRLFGMKCKQYKWSVGSFPLLAMDGMYLMEPQ